MGNGRQANGKSILDLMTLAAECGAAVDLEVSGPDAEASIEALAGLIEARFHETEYAEAARPGPGPAGQRTCRGGEDPGEERLSRRSGSLLGERSGA
jgi:hypothetical protein